MDTPVDLDNTLTIDDTTYNINAVNANHSSSADAADTAATADKAKQLTTANVGDIATPVYFKSGVPVECASLEATKVKNALTINEYYYDDKAEEKSKVEKKSFTGEDNQTIEIVPATGGKFTGNIYTNNVTEIKDESVLNYSDIKHKVLTNLLNNSVLYTWNGSEVVGNENGSDIKNVCIVTGESANVNSFAELNKNSKTFPAYIYVATDGKIYFGTYKSSTPSGVEVSAENAIKANQLTEERKLKVDLEATTDSFFNGTADVTLGVSGKLAPANGGTGKDSLDKVTVGVAKSVLTKVIASGSSTDENSAIIISSSNPSGGKNGDIWIKY
jgi:hypothetical protein